MGIPVSCEVDIYGALSEYIGTCVTGDARHAAGHQQHRARAIMYERSIKRQVRLPPQRDLHGLPLRQHAAASRLINPHDEVSADHEARSGARPASPTSPAARWRATSCPATSPSSVCSATADTELQAYVAQGEILPVDCRVLRRHRRVRHPGNGPLLPSCADRRSAIRTTARWPSAITARRCLRCSSIWASRT